MGGFFGTISTKNCVNDLFYGTDYNSHLGTRRAGLVTFDQEKGFSRKIHNLERDYFRSKFEDELDSFSGNQGIGVISDTDPQPILVNSHLGRYAVVTVAKINNIEEIAQELLDRRMHFSEYSANTINQTELVALLINGERHHRSPRLPRTHAYRHRKERGGLCRIERDDQFSESGISSSERFGARRDCISDSR